MGLAAVIMAGGRGERFWPKSREDRPKQFLTFHGQRSLLQQTVDRLAGLIEPEAVWVVTRSDYAALVEAQVPSVPREQLLLEPVGRDTAPCVALAALHLARQDPTGIMLLLPADHLVWQEERFRSILAAAVKLAATGDHLVTLGMRPTRPETGYGYIQTGAEYGGADGYPAYRVASFREKPNREQATAYLQAGGYLWNSGIFVWKVSTILAALEQHLPQLMEGLKPLAAVMGTEQEAEVLRRLYPTLPKISIDYGVMERAANVLVIPADFGWDDLGTWAALERVVPVDTDGNIISGRALAVETAGSLVQSLHDRLVLTFGVSDLLVVDSADAVLVASKARAADLKLVVGRLEAEGLHRYLMSPKVDEA